MNSLGNGMRFEWLTNIIGSSNGKGRNVEAVRTKISCLCCTTNDRLEYRREGLPLCDSDWSTVSLYRLEIRKRTGCSQNNSYVRSLITEDCSNVTRLFFLFSSKTRTVPKKRRAIRHPDIDAPLFLANRLFCTFNKRHFATRFFFSLALLIHIHGSV